MKMKKWFCLLLSCFLLAACATTKNPVDIVESTDPFTIQFFYSTTCPHCKQLKENLLPKIEEEFQNQVTIEMYDIDDEASIDLYDSYIGLYNQETESWVLEGSLAGVDEEIAAYNRYIPFVVVGDYYAFMGYTEELLDDYIQDIHLALQGQSLARGEVSKGRWLFKQS